MGQKIVISEDEVKNIKRLYGILNEDVVGCNYSKWVNGDGITKPKITATLTNDQGLFIYEGPEKGFCIHHKDGNTDDSIHQLSNVVIDALGPYLKENFKKGVFLNPYFDNLKMEYKPNYFKIEFDIFEFNIKQMACTHVDHRGGLNHTMGDSEYKKLKSILDANPFRYDINSEGEGKYSEYVLADNTKNFIKENWIGWLDEEWVKKNPPTKQTSVTTINQPIDNNSNQKIDTMSTNEPETKQTNKTDDLSNKPTVSQTNTPKETPVSPKTKVKIVNGKIVKID